MTRVLTYDARAFRRSLPEHVHRLVHVADQAADVLLELAEIDLAGKLGRARADAVVVLVITVFVYACLYA